MAFLLDDILMAPCKLVCCIGRALHDQAEGELTDESLVQEQLLALQTQLELGEINEHEYLRRERALMRRLEDIRKYKESRQRRTDTP